MPLDAPAVPTGRAAERRQAAAAVHRQIARGRPEAALTAAEAAARRFPDSLTVVDALISALDLNEQWDRALVLAVEAASRREQRLRASRRAREPRTLTPDARLFLSGYFHSGSGAVLEFLKDFEGVAKWSPAGEPRMIKFPGGTADLAKRFRTSGDLGPADLVDFYLHLAGSKGLVGSGELYSRWGMVNRQSGKLLKHPSAAGYVAEGLACFGRLTRAAQIGGLSVRQVNAILRDGFRDALDAAATDTGAERLLVDQAVNAWRLKIAALAPPSTFIVVHRDPRDQYADALAALDRPGRIQLSAEAFAIQFRQRRLAGEGAMARLVRKYKHRIITVPFEAFVMRHETEAPRLLAEIGFEDRRRVRRRYKVEASRPNVGKYRTLISPEDAAYLARELPEYLSPDLPA